MVMVARLQLQIHKSLLSDRSSRKSFLNFSCRACRSSWIPMRKTLSRTSTFEVG